MKFKSLKTKEEYNQMKDEMSSEIDTFLQKFNTFITSTSPDYWRSTGSLFTDLKNFKNNKLQELEPLTDKNLEQEWIRKEVLTDEEQEMWDAYKKYNI